MSATLMSKLPTVTRPIKLDADMAKALERMLEPYSGKALERAQVAVRKVYGSGLTGTFEAMLAHYRAAISAAVKDKET
jgi:hypothetical protein